MTPDLSILIVNWNTRELLAGCLASLERAHVDMIERYDVETLVIDNASTDSSAAMVRERFPWVRLIENVENVGFGQANNRAIVQSKGRYTLLLNSDTIVPNGAISRLLQVAEEHPDVGAVGCMLRNLDGTFQASYNDFPTLTGEWLSALGLARRLLSPQYPSHSEADSRKPRLVDWIPGSAMLLRTAPLKQICGFDERYSMYSEETDLCWRLHQAGWKVLYTPEIQIFHLGGGSASRASARQVRMLYKSKKLFFERSQGAMVALLYSLGVRLATALKIGAWSFSLMLASPQRRANQLTKLRSHLPLITTCW
jgi:GT2 family glycosyltransferase